MGKRIDAIVGAFDRHNLARGYGYYWLCYVVNLSTAERIIIRPYDVPYSPHDREAVEGQERLGFINYQDAPNNPKSGILSLGAFTYKVVSHENLIENMQFYELEKISELN